MQREMTDKISEHTHQLFPSFKKPENNILLLLTWSSTIHGRPLQVLRGWASSGETSGLYRRLREDFQESEQLTLILAALLCHERLCPYALNDTVELLFIYGLVDLGLHSSVKYLSNPRKVLKDVCYSFIRALEIFDECKGLMNFLAVVLAKVCLLEEEDQGEVLSSMIW